LQKAKSFGVSAGQLGISGDIVLPGVEESWKAAIAEEDFVVTTAVCSYTGEDYADIPTVKKTVGLVPVPTRAERVARTKEIATLASKLGIKSVTCHIGFVPHDSSDPLYKEILDVARDICDHCAPLNQSFTLETGQEPADVLLRFVHDVDRSNLKINFDPANMILYGSGDPIEALRALSKYVISVHCKDGDWPPKNDPDALGKERALGTGSVGIPRFVETLKEIGYKGLLAIEREEPDLAQRDADFRSGIALLKSLTGR
jgi:sugar phosphate isomerase/epimerase